MRVIDDIMSDVEALNQDGDPLLYITRRSLRAILTERLVPEGRLDGCEPVICYFGSEEDREEFIQAVKDVKPDMRSIKL